MPVISAILLGFALAMDAFAVSVTNGITQCKAKFQHALLTAAMFGLFQGLMPFIGWLLGSSFAGYITAVDHWIAFVLLSIIGANMIVESVKEKDDVDPDVCVSFSFKILFFEAIATSIDALIAGVSFPQSGIISASQAILAAAIIAGITFVFCTFGFYIGKFFGNVFKKAPQIVGGVILIGLGVKVLIEHLFFS